MRRQFWLAFHGPIKYVHGSEDLPWMINESPLSAGAKTFPPNPTETEEANSPAVMLDCLW